MSVTGGIPQGLDLALLIARLVAGGMFASSGWLKLTRADRRQAMVKSLRTGKIPAPDLMARIVPVFELLAGLALAVGAGTVLASVVLLVISLTALVTVTAKEAAGEGSPLMRLSSLLYTSEAMLIALLAVLIATGAGAWSVDAAL